MLLLLLFFRMLLILFWGVVFLPLHLFPLHLASLCVCVFFLLVTCCRVQHGPCSVVVLRRSAWVSRRSVWSRDALPRRLSQCRCECELVCPCESLVSRVPVVPLPLRSKHRGTTLSPLLTLLLVGRTGWLHMQRRQNHLPAPPARTAPLRSFPS